MRASECTIRAVSDARQALPPPSSFPARPPASASSGLCCCNPLSLPRPPSLPSPTRLAFAAVVELLSVSRLAPRAKEAKGTKSGPQAVAALRKMAEIYTYRTKHKPARRIELPCILHRSGRRSGSRTPCRRRPCRGPDRCRRTLKNEGERRTRLLTRILNISRARARVCVCVCVCPLSLKKATCATWA